MLFFGSFDAIVLIASVYILFPHEHAEYTGSILQHFQWTIERFSAMQDRNPLAKSAQGVLRAIVARFKKAISNVTPCSNGKVESSVTPISDGRLTNAATESTPASSLSAGEPYSYPQPTAESEWTFQPTDGFTSIAPMFATGDLIYNDLNAFHGDGLNLPPMGEESIVNPADYDWQFGGDWGDDTVWQLFNQIQPEVGGEALG